MNRLINATIMSRVTDIFFRFFELLLKLIALPIKILKLIVRKVISEPIDNLLSGIGKHVVARKTIVDNSSIVFTTMQGEYTCNPKYIAEEILKRKLPYKITWVKRGPSLGPYPKQFKFVRDNTPSYFKSLARAKVVIQNGHSMQKNGVRKSSGQYWIQTWHGSLGLKKLEGAGGNQRYYRKMQKLDNTDTDLVIVNSDFESDVFTNTYWRDVSKPMLGHARNDILFDKSASTAKRIRNKVLSRLNLPDTGQKFLLYAPTHGDGRRGKAFGALDLDGLRKALSDKFGGNWEILIRTHNSNKRRSDAWLSGLPSYCHNASYFPDMQELLMVADAGLSDYSSWVSDYIHTGKPAFLHAPDLDAYNKSRGFYFDFADTPFTVALNNRELLRNIETFDNSRYKKKIQKFLKSCGSIDDGKSAKRIVDEIERIMAS